MYQNISDAGGSSIFHDYNFTSGIIPDAVTPYFKKEISDDSNILPPSYILDFSKTKVPEKQFKSQVQKKVIHTDLDEIAKKANLYLKDMVTL